MMFQYLLYCMFMIINFWFFVFLQCCLVLFKSSFSQCLCYVVFYIFILSLYLFCWLILYNIFVLSILLYYTIAYTNDLIFIKFLHFIIIFVFVLSLFIYIYTCLHLHLQIIILFLLNILLHIHIHIYKHCFS